MWAGWLGGAVRLFDQAIVIKSSSIPSQGKTSYPLFLTNLHFVKGSSWKIFKKTLAKVLKRWGSVLEVLRS